MKSKTNFLLPWLIAATISVFSGSTQATPKAAENEEAPVTLGADVAKPKLTAKAGKPAKPKITMKAKPVRKSKAPNKVKATPRKK